MPVQPGQFVVLGARPQYPLDPTPPAGLAKSEPVLPRRYVGRVTDVLKEAWAVTLWEVPNGRELVSNISRAPRTGITKKGLIRRGTPINVWTWAEKDHATATERLHFEPMIEGKAKRR